MESRILEVILLKECGILSFGIRNTVHDWNPESKFYWQILESSTSVESGIHRVECRIQDCPGFRILEVIFLMESGILTFGIRNTAQGIRNPLESSTWNPESTAWNAESKTVLDSFTWDETNLRVNQENKDGDKAWHPNTSRYLYLFLCPRKVSKTDHWKDVDNVSISLLVSWF